MDLASLETAIEKSLQYYSSAAGKGPRRMDDTLVTVRELQESLIALREILRSGMSPTEVKQVRIRETFDVYQSTGSDGKNTVLFTGYFESIMKGSLTKTEKYRYPIYRAPDDAVAVNLGKFGEKYQNEQLVGRVKNGELVPYYSRSEIEDLGSLAGRNLELAWVDDRIDLFFLHTQGSGKIELPDGRLLQIGYALKNGRPFQSLAHICWRREGSPPQEISYQSIKRYLREHPEELSEILGHNESFMFFREVTEGPRRCNRRDPDAGTLDCHRCRGLSARGARLHAGEETDPRQGRQRRILDPLFPFRRQSGCGRCDQGGGAGRSLLRQRR